MLYIYKCYFYRLLLPKDSRIIAETLFKLGIAEELRGNGDQGSNLLANAKTILDQRIKMLENLNDDESKHEMAEIKSIILEIMDKIDIKKREITAMSRLLVDNDARANKEITMNSGTLSTIKHTSDISHLVLKRSKLDEETDGTQNKISKLEELAAAK